MTLVQRIEATKFQGGGQTLKSLLAIPFYVLGWLIGKTWWIIRFGFSSFVTGFEDGAKRGSET